MKNTCAASLGILVSLFAMGCKEANSPDAVIQGLNVAVAKNKIKVMRAIVTGEAAQSLGTDAGFEDFRKQVDGRKVVFSAEPKVTVVEQLPSFSATETYLGQLSAESKYQHGDGIDIALYATYESLSMATIQCTIDYEFTACSTFTNQNQCIYRPSPAPGYSCMVSSDPHGAVRQAWCSEESLTIAPKIASKRCMLTALR